jgi:hypothetical protein
MNHLLRQVPPDLLPDYYVGRITRELWWTKKEIQPVDDIQLFFSLLIYHNSLTDGRSSET